MRIRFGTAVVLAGLLSVLSAATSVVAALPGRPRPAVQEPAPAPVQEPQDEASLWKAIEEATGQGLGSSPKVQEWLARLAKDYPDSKQLPEALFRLALLDGQSGRRPQAAERFRLIAEKHPSHARAPEALLHWASWLGQQKRKAEARDAYKKLLREYPGSEASESALWQYWNLVDKTFQFSVHQSYTEGQEVVVNGNLRNVDKVDYKLFRLDPQALLRRLDAGDDFGRIQSLVASVPPESRKTIKEWTEEPVYERNRWKSVALKPEIREAGLYVLEAVHDEIAVQVGIVVARYGLVVRSAANKAVVFAVDRRSGRAIEGMALRIAQGKERFEGKTGADGLYVHEKGVNGTVVGVHEGEIALTNLSYSPFGDEARGYLYTDRPIYRPNQVVQFKAVHRQVTRVPDGPEAGSERLVTPPAGQQAQVTIQDPRGNAIYRRILPTDAFGTVAGELRLGDEPPLGMYTVYSSLGGYGQFRVEEYRKPEYEVEARFVAAPYLSGDDLQGEIAVKYYFGSPVVEADLNWELYRRPLYRGRWYGFEESWGWDDDDDDDDDDYEYSKRKGRGYYGPGERVAQGVGKTDRNGKVSVRHPSAKDGGDVEYTLVARVVDKSRREVSGTCMARVTRSQLELGVSASRYLYRPGDQVEIKVRAADMEGKAVADQVVSITVSTAKYWRRDKESGYEHGDFHAAESRTDATGVASFSFPAEKEGYLRVRAVAKDRRDVECSAEHWIWVSGRSWSSDFQNFTGLDLVPDKTVYAAGDTARVLVTSQHKNVQALFTVEANGVLRQEVLEIKGHTALVEVPVVAALHAPNVYFSVATMVGNEFLNRSRSVSVPPADRLLKFTVSMDKAQYRPREEMKVTVSAVDSAGRPVEADLSVGMVDESIYALQPELARDVRKHFYARRWNRVHVDSSMHYYDRGRSGYFGAKGGEGGGAPQGKADRSRGLAEESKELEKAKSAKPGEPMAETETRAYFPDTMFWRSNARTGADGKFSFAVAAPDSLTTWRTTVRGLTADSRVGHARHEVVVRKEVIVRLAAPRFFTQNDECVVSGVVHNYRDDVSELKVSFQAAGVELVGPSEQVIGVPKGGDRRVDWKVIARRPGTAVLTARAESSKESDAMRIEIPVLPHGIPQILVKAGVLEEGGKVSVTVPDTAIPEATELMVCAEPSVASQIAGVVEYLAGYPYGCVEQTMSRFLPSVVAARSMRQLGLRNPKLEKELPDMVAKGLQRLYNFQHADGGWGWWESDNTNAFMTAYVVYGLAKAREADFPVEDNVLHRGVASLKAMLKARGEDPRDFHRPAPLDTRAYLVFALTEAGASDKASLTEMYDARAELSNYGKALVAISLARSGRPSEARDVLANLDETAKQGEAHCWWEGHAQRYHWMSQVIETTAYVLRAYVLVDPQNPKVHKVVRWLAANRQGDRWNSTKDSAAIVYALSDYVAATGETDADYALTVKVDGKELLSARATKENLFSFDGTRTLKGTAVPKGAREISFEKTGKGRIYYSVRLQVFNAADRFDAVSGTVSIERTYARVTYDGKERIVEPLKEGDVLKSGDLVEVTLDLTADGAHEYMMIEDPLPAGFEVQKEERFAGGGPRRGRWGWWYARIEARDERVCIAATAMDGRRSVSYLMRAEQPGDFRILPSRAYNMYVPEIAGSSAGSRIRVEDAK